MHSYYFLMELKLWPKWLRYASLRPSFPPSLPPFFLTVHAVMYSYYFLMELKLWPKWLRYVPPSLLPSLPPSLLTCTPSCTPTTS